MKYSEDTCNGSSVDEPFVILNEGASGVVLNQIIINLNNGADWPKLKRRLKFLLLKKQAWKE